MEHLEAPDESLWEIRRQWFETTQAELGQAGAGQLSEQACALMIELQVVFCAGAWAAAVIVAMAVVEAQERVTPGGLSWLERSDFRWLLALRNSLVHETRGKPSLTVEDQWLKRDIWEGRARRAVGIALRALYPLK